MVKLPKLTLLCGRWGQSQVALAKLLCAEDDNLIRMDFTAPVHDAIANLFPEGMPVTKDPLECLKDTVLVGSDSTVLDLMENLVTALRSTFGINYLGIHARNYLESHDTYKIFERVIYTDCNDEEDAQLVIEYVGPDNSLAIFMGDMDYIPHLGLIHLPCKQLWLPIPEANKQLEYLRKELG